MNIGTDYSSVASQATSSSTTSSSTEVVSKEEFLNLLVTQMQHQDPLNPQDPTEYTAQLAQFSSLEQLISVNQALEDLSSINSYGVQIASASFIGKSVRVAGDSVTVSGGQASSIRYDLPRDSESTTLNIYNSAGDLVDTVNLGTQTAGTHDYQWSATTSGGAVSDGQYYCEFSATDASDQAITVDTSFTGTVTGLSYDQGTIMLKIGGQEWPMSDVLAVDTAG